MTTHDHVEYLLRLGDNTLVGGQRLSEWVGHGPVLEEDIALSNVALDLIGQARWWLTRAGTVEGQGRTEDDLAFLRDGTAFRNVLLVEQPNGPTRGGPSGRGGDFGVTIARQWLFDTWHVQLLQHLVTSSDDEIAAIAAKAHKEATYHHRHSAQWVIRLGDGTDHSHHRMQQAIDALWRFTGELFTPDDVDERIAAAGIGPDPSALKAAFDASVDAVLAEATLQRPADGWMQTGGKQGEHTEHLGYLLAEMQHLQRTYVGASW
ncbi:MAG: phenylacetate-CoA oxygenase subunit PaaC [Myxococcales bacterium]|nr:phenylacetate-CoA oxygenase subunit PaaC [Myxococcales bacterium]